eukprot:gnl/TRDRNA2_/TRDRNA2_154773_c0_seq1.p1 gnl/TRDRNA2_/TRDRNA2_154773_c0~~gnl/TRDRNA2_/TRDRNA2_154773_c0_seq1.p1  ORF type:complete len:204 (+),score=22.64 gnl/TRDRNA2_/TRDRNA2_154773_c0_seq1:38-613(+)
MLPEDFYSHDGKSAYGRLQNVVMGRTPPPTIPPTVNAEAARRRETIERIFNDTPELATVWYQTGDEEGPLQKLSPGFQTKPDIFPTGVVHEVCVEFTVPLTNRKCCRCQEVRSELDGHVITHKVSELLHIYELSAKYSDPLNLTAAESGRNGGPGTGLLVLACFMFAVISFQNISRCSLSARRLQDPLMMQ